MRRRFLIASALVAAVITANASGCVPSRSAAGGAFEPSTLSVLQPRTTPFPAHVTLPAFTRFDLSRYARDVVRSGPTGRRRVALTFDDGPSQDTSAVLDALRVAGARATFFFVAGRTIGREYRVAQVLAQGSEVGNHTFNHVGLTHMTPESFDSEVMRPERLFLKEVGWAPRLVRPRAGAYDATLPPLCRKAGLVIALWDVQADDANRGATVDSITRNATAVHPGAIVVMHETNPRTVKALPGILRDLKSRGYELVTVSELLADR